MRRLTAGLLNINEAQLTIDVMDRLASLPGETWAVQLILVDNGSSEDQVHQLLDWLFANNHRFAEVLFVNAFQNLGVNGGRNQILKLASEDMILLLDNDVVLPTVNGDWLDTLWQRMEEDSEVAITGPMLVFADYPEIVQATGIALTERGRVGYLNRAEPVDKVPPTQTEVICLPAACWLMRKKAQQAIGLFSDEYYPIQYEDVDFCVRLGQAGWKIICDCRVRIKHIGNVTTRNLKSHPFARVTVQQAMRFRRKWARILPQIATITDDEIYWGPIPPPKN